MSAPCTVTAALSSRLAAVLEMVPQSAVFADIGSDHGLLAQAVLECGRAGRVIASDISPGFVEKARPRVDEKVELRCADGLFALHEAEAAVIAICGMGAKTMVDILVKGARRLGGAALVLSPHAQAGILRAYLANNGYRIEAERLVEHDRRFYPIILARPGDEALDEAQCHLGPRLMETMPVAFQTWLVRQQRRLDKVVKGGGVPRAARELVWIEKAMAIMERVDGMTKVSIGMHHVALKVPDYDKAFSFYTQGLGMSVRLTWGEGEGRAAMLDMGDGAIIELFGGGEEAKPMNSGFFHLALKVEDVDAAYARAIAHGAKPDQAPKDINVPSTPERLVARIAFVVGLGGESIEFFKEA